MTKVLHPHHRKAIKRLKKDPVMRRLIARHDPPFWASRSNVFADLVESIIGQQLSDKAATTIVKRFRSLFKKRTKTVSRGLGEIGLAPSLSKAFPKPEEVAKMRISKLRKCGISGSKARYIKGVARAVCSGALRPKHLHKMNDSDVRENLIRLKGVGDWTAEMILMFSLKRPDVFSVGDLGLRAAIARLYDVKREDRKRIEKISERWKPYRTFAARYLWKSLGEKN